MFLKALTVALLGSMALFEHATATNAHGPFPRAAGNPSDYASLRASIIRQRSSQHRSRAVGAKALATATDGGQGATATCLAANAIQTGSDNDGQSGNVTAGQVRSATDPSNFINFCSGQTLTNGLQVKNGSCNGIVMGKIPSVDNMISSVLISPKPGEDLSPNSDIDIVVQTTGLTAGFFTNAQLTYYGAPQDLDKSGRIIGHTHVTVQDLGKSLTPSQAPDPKTFVFFKGINDAGNGKGLLSTTITGGLPPGNYRVCTMSSSANHTPVLMPVAQRGAQDDCTKFTVGAGSSSSASGNTPPTKSTSTSSRSATATAPSESAAESGSGKSNGEGKNN